eukprot:8898318-Lingulodinium_polyedra.AAC.1
MAQHVGPERVADSMNPGRMGGQLLLPSNEGIAQGTLDELGRINRPRSSCRSSGCDAAWRATQQVLAHISPHNAVPR